MKKLVILGITLMAFLPGAITADNVITWRYDYVRSIGIPPYFSSEFVILASGDLTGNGDTELVAGKGSTLSVWSGDDRDMFSQIATIPVDGLLSPRSTGIVVDDLDADGNSEFIVGTTTGELHIYQYDPVTGTFVEEFQTAGLGSYLALAVDDFDGDLDSELAVLSYSGEVQIFEYNGGSLELSWAESCYNYSDKIASGDLDGFGGNEIIVGASNKTCVVRYTGSYTIDRLGRLFGCGDGYIRTLSTGDIYANDPADEVIVGSGWAGQLDQVGVFRWLNFTLSPLSCSGVGWTKSVRSVLAADTDDDGFLELIVGGASYLAGTVDVLEFTETFQGSPVWGIYFDGSWGAGGKITDLESADLSGNGRTEFVTAHRSGRLYVFRRSSLSIEIDIRPSTINPYQRGVVPVVILGAGEFDVADILVRTFRFGPNRAPTKHDLTDSFDYNEHLEDVNLDGIMDLILHFETQETGIDCGDTEATLSGQTLAFCDPLACIPWSFEGTDTFETVGCNSNRPRRGMTSRDTEQMQRQQPRLNSEEQQHPGDLVEEQRVD